MNLFRSWTGFDPAAAEGIIPLADVVTLFSGDFFQKRFCLDYVSRNRDYLGTFVAAIMEIAKTRPFWLPGVH
jgi:hypothetical protein